MGGTQVAAWIWHSSEAWVRSSATGPWPSLQGLSLPCLLLYARSHCSDPSAHPITSWKQLLMSRCSCRTMAAANYFLLLNTEGVKCRDTCLFVSCCWIWEAGKKNKVKEHWDGERRESLAWILKEGVNSFPWCFELETVVKAWSEQGNCETPWSAFILLLALMISKEAAAEGNKRKESSKR